MDRGKQPVIFDGHNDVLLRLDEPGGAARFFERGTTGHLDLPRAKEGGLGGGIFAVFVPSPENPERTPNGLPVALDQRFALAEAMSAVATLIEIEDISSGRFRIAKTAGEIRTSLSEGVMPAVLHLEGADPIDPELDALRVLYRAGLRSIGLVWGRPNAFAEGLRPGFRGSANTGPGLTEAGKNLVRTCNELGVMLDVSHLNEKGFWAVAEHSDAPVVATHSNAYAVCPSSRNLTDVQLDAISDSGGIVGLNFGVHFTREDGIEDENTPIDAMLRQVDYLVGRVGIEHVGFGSDFDGITISREIGDASGLPKLMDALRARGYGDGELAKISHENWLRVLERTFGE